MNRLILIGNGFDLSHQLKTDYNSFIVWYIKQCFYNAISSSDKSYEDDIISLTTTLATPNVNLNHEITTIFDAIDYFYKKGIKPFFDDNSLFFDGQAWNHKPFKIKIKSSFFREIVLKCSNVNWVDIEVEFYENLKSLIKVEEPKKTSLLEQLNKSIAVIIHQLEEYLATIHADDFSKQYCTVFDSLLQKRDIINTEILDNELPEESLILNFNYTPTVENYFNNMRANIFTKSNIEINYIHGKIGDSLNRPVFGFGDELDREYLQIELGKNNQFFEYIKSFSYFKTSNYHDLIRFIESNLYQVFILGHSCGLSDRTLLNMIFEHHNCKSIKIYYHEKADGTNNHKHLTQEISRHFKDKVSMRKKIVPFDKSFKMPQITVGTRL